MESTILQIWMVGGMAVQDVGRIYATSGHSVGLGAMVSLLVNPHESTSPLAGPKESHFLVVLATQKSAA